METLFSVIVSKLMSRSLSFLIHRYQQHTGLEVHLRRLHLVLLRIGTIVEEAEERHIMNHRDAPATSDAERRHASRVYMLDTFRYQTNQDKAKVDKAKDKVNQGHYSSALPIFNPAKLLCFPVSNTQGMASAINSMKSYSKYAGMNEFVVFLMNYPHLNCQPYSTYLVLDKCMFGRQAEMEQITSFLLRTEVNDNKNLGVLPVVGIARVGKSTLVEHVCHDGRVRNYFSLIVFLSGNDLEDEKLNAPGDFGLIKHQNHASHRSSLVILELAEDEVVDDGRWRRLCSSASCKARGSKIIIMSRSGSIQSFGTVEALKLKSLHQEAYWYFFKVFTFGSMNHEEHPS